MLKRRFQEFVNNFKSPKYLFLFFLIALAYFFSARFGLSLAGVFRQVSLVWPATGVSIAALLIFGWKYWPAIFVGSLTANLINNTALGISFGIAIGNSLEAIVAYWFLNRFGFKNDIGRIKDAFVFIIFAAVVSAAVSATFGVSSLIFGGIGSWSGFWMIWSEWWLGNMIGALVVGPFLLVRSDLGDYLRFDFKTSGTSFILISTFVLICLLISTPFISTFFVAFPLQYLLLPTIILSSFLLKQRGSTFTVLILAVFSVLNVVMGWGDSGLILVQIFIGTLASFFLLFSALVLERTKAITKADYSERKFKSLVEHSYDGVVLVDITGQVVYASPSTKHILGWTADEITGKSGFNLIFPDDRKLLASKLKELLSESGKIATTEYRSLHKDGKVHYMEGTGVNLLKDPAVNAIVVNFRDITERKRLDEAKSEFVSFTAHELRSPLSTMRWTLETLLGSDKPLSQRTREHLQTIYAANLKMTDTVNMLLSVNRMEMGTLVNKPEPVDIVSLIEQTLLTYNQEVKIKKLTIKKDLPPNDQPYVYVDPSLMDIIISNLISNAIKYTPKSGVISVTAKVLADNLHFKVEDTGVGIPDKQKARIFTKSFRADNVKSIVSEGSGLGLYLTKSVVDLMGGGIKFTSQENKGTTFEIVIPIEKHG